MNVLVSGVGAIIGYGVIRSLRAALPETRLVGTDIYADAVGQGWCDVFECAPPTADPSYLNWLACIVRKHNIDLIIPGIEQDVYRLSTERDFLLSNGIRVALNSHELIQLCCDKWEMHEVLRKLHDPARIPSMLADDFDELESAFGVPFILKPRRSYASKGLVRIYTREDFALYAEKMGNVLMAQPIVGTDEDEYTAAVFGDGKGSLTASILLKRKLAADGSTVKAWVRSDSDIYSAVQRLVTTFRPLGPTNLQFRRTEDDVKLLEINPRLSSSTSIRRAFGYNESAMCVDYFMNGQLPVQPVIRSGFAVRFIEDFIVYDRDHF